MAKDFRNDIRMDTASKANSDTDQDYGGDIASDDGVDLNDTTEYLPETSTLSNILTAGKEGMYSPSELAELGGEIIGPPGAEDASAQALQAGYNISVEGIKGMADGLYQHYGPSDGGLQMMQIYQAIEAGSQHSGKLPDNEDIYDGETGVNLTDEKLRE